VKASWEVGEPSGAFHSARDMAVNLVCIRRLVVKAHAMAMHPFLGTYDFAGLLSSRPFFLQRTQEDQRFAVWYAEEPEQWVITEDFRLLDCITVDARVSDTAWFPWDVGSPWQISDRVGGFCPDAALQVEAVP